MKSTLLTFSAITAIAAVTALPADAADQTPSQPAGTQYNPQPTVAEELVYLRDIIALQTLRLDEAEQNLKHQNELIEKQQNRINALERVLKTTQMAGAGGASLAGEYIVQQGDTLGKVAAKFGATIEDIAAANNLSAPYPLSIGQQLVIPGAASPVAVAAAEKPVQSSPPNKEAEQQKKVEQIGGESQKPASPTVVAATETSTVGPETRPDVTRRVVEEERKRKEKKPEGGAPEEVGVRPEEEERPYLSVFSDIGGILTPRGRLYVEPAADFSVSSDNRFFFQGVEIADAILIGAIDATDSDRRAYTQSLGMRYGVTNRIELDGRVSYVTRDDRISGVSIDNTTQEQSGTFRNLHGSGLGDAEMGLHLQMTNGRKFPYTILNLRAKAPTGTGPFEVGREANGIETELAVGSGYWTVEPSLTFILPSDPAVIFANIGYQLNMSTMPDAIITTSSSGAATQIMREFDPGDAIRTSIGVGLSLNDRLSLNFGYDQSHILATKIMRDLRGNGNEPFVSTISRQSSSTVGAFLFGGSYAVSDGFRLNFNTAVGATDEAPDIRVTLRAQIRLFD